MERLRLEDMSDREVLWVIDDVSAADGWATSLDIAEQLGITHKRKTTCVGSRMAWLKRWGVVEGDDGRWRVTPVGEVLMRGELTRTQENTLVGLGDEKLLMAVRALTTRLARAGRPEAMILGRREFRRGMM